MKEVLLKGQDLCKTFPQGNGKNTVLDRLDVEIYQGDFTVMMGASGVGKSTLLYCLSGMDSVTGGEVLYKNRPISGLSEQKMAALRGREFGFVFQQTHLVSSLTLLENVLVAGAVGKKHPQGELWERALSLLTRMGVEGAKDRFPSQVSGGEAQRAAIARAMIGEPGLLFADEPTGALNRQSSGEVLSLLSGLHENGQSILMVTHDVRAASRGNRILYMEDGRILSELLLPDFRAEDAKEREERVTAWLSSLRW